MENSGDPDQMDLDLHCFLKRIYHKGFELKKGTFMVTKYQTSVGLVEMKFCVHHET